MGAETKEYLMNMHARHPSGLRQETCLAIPSGVQRHSPSLFEWRGLWHIGPFPNDGAANRWGQALYNALTLKSDASHVEQYTLFIMERGMKKKTELLAAPRRHPGKVEFHFVLDFASASVSRGDVLEFHTDPRGISPHELAQEFNDHFRTALRAMLND